MFYIWRHLSRAPVLVVVRYVCSGGNYEKHYAYNDCGLFAWYLILWWVVEHWVSFVFFHVFPLGWKYSGFGWLAHSTSERRPMSGARPYSVCRFVQKSAKLRKL